jgi:triosephosphate isomerase (TIM)
MTPPKALVAGNWKMNGLSAAVAELSALSAQLGQPTCDVMICPPFTLISRFADAAKGSAVAIGAQDCHANASGAHTGDISAEMLADSGACAVIVGHSERRADHGESDAVVAAKAQAVVRAGLTAILCIGETRAQRDAGQTLEVVEKQLTGSIPADMPADRLVLAYEPVWAIGTGLTPTAADVTEVHAAIRAHLVLRYGQAGHGVRILYGGSVKPTNAVELMGQANVNGALVGGASLKAVDFLGIIAAYRQ